VPYVIGGECIDVNDMSCVEECPVEAITQDRRVSDENEPHIADSRRFFVEILPGRDAPLGSPGGATKVGKIGVDTELVAGL